jgi:Zn-finger nucleic acid-binding protein
MAPYRTAELVCPQCNVQLEATLCPKCAGGWVSESSLQKRLDVVAVDNTQLPKFDGFEKTGLQKYDCPVCHDPLDVVRTNGIEVERCAAAHGIWFDAEELRTVLLKASEGRDVDSSANMYVVKPSAAGALLDALLCLIYPSDSLLW